MIEILHMQKELRKKINQVQVLFHPCVSGCSPPSSSCSAGSYRIIDVKRVFVLHTGVLCKSPPLLIESQLVTQPAKINNIAAIIKLIIISLTNCTINFRCGNHTFDRFSSIPCKQCKTEMPIWGSLVPKTCLPRHCQQSGREGLGMRLLWGVQITEYRFVGLAIFNHRFVNL